MANIAFVTGKKKHILENVCRVLCLVLGDEKPACPTIHNMTQYEIFMQIYALCRITGTFWEESLRTPADVWPRPGPHSSQRRLQRGGRGKKSISMLIVL